MLNRIGLDFFIIQFFKLTLFFDTLLSSPFLSPPFIWSFIGGYVDTAEKIKNVCKYVAKKFFILWSLSWWVSLLHFYNALSIFATFLLLFANIGFLEVFPEYLFLLQNCFIAYATTWLFQGSWILWLKETEESLD